MAASSPKPVIILAHGAWHHPLHYKALISGLQAQGYTVLSPLNATVGVDDAVAGKTYKDDVKRIHEYLLPVLDEGREVVVICHSYGGVPGTASIEGHSVEERAAKGLEGGVKSVLYIASLLPPVRDFSLWELLGKGWPNWHREEGPLRITETSAAETFYNDSSPQNRSWAFSMLMFQSVSCFMTPVGYVASDLKISKTYVVCTEDKAIGKEAQHAMAGAAQARIVELSCGHSPFLKEKETQELIKLVDGIAVN